MNLMYIITLNLLSIVTVSILGDGVADTATQEVDDIGSVGAGHTKDISSSDNAQLSAVLYPSQ